MVKMQFRSKPRKVGGSWLVVIPMAYVENNIIPTDHETIFSFEVDV